MNSLSMRSWTTAKQIVWLVYITSFEPYGLGKRCDLDYILSCQLSSERAGIHEYADQRDTC